MHGMLPGEESQRARLHLARVALDHTFQFIGLCDREGRLWEANNAALEGAGIRRSDIHGIPFWETRWFAGSEAAQERLKAGIRQAAEGRFVRYDLEVYGQEGGTGVITVDFNIKPVADRSGKVVFLIVEGRDVTEQRAADRILAEKSADLEAVNERLHEHDALRTQFFANVSHELRTPLALVLGPAQRMRGRADLPPDAHRNLDLIIKNTQLVLKHVNDLLDVAKLDAGRMAPRYVHIDLGRALRLITDRFQGIAEEKNIHTEIGIAGAVTADVDPDMFDRILANLLANAFKFTPEGGTVGTHLRQQDDQVVVEVSDTGPGIPESMRERVFERFRQIEDGPTRRFGGTGLGLTIVRQFVEQHGGTVEVDQAHEGGARFTVRLPLRAPKGKKVETGRRPTETSLDLSTIVGTLEGPPRSELARGPIDTARPTILVVEDNHQMRSFIVDCLRDHYNVAVAEDGREALDRLDAHRIDLILTDIMMPRMSGDRLVAEVRARPQTRDIPIVLLTAKADAALRVRLLREGAQDYIQKPFQEAELVARVQNLVAHKRARDALQEGVENESRDLWALAQQVSQHLSHLRGAVGDSP